MLESDLKEMRESQQACFTWKAWLQGAGRAQEECEDWRQGLGGEEGTGAGSSPFQAWGHGKACKNSQKEI